MTQKLWYLVAYDVRDPKRLREVAHHLEGYGERLQFSVFRCRLTERESMLANVGAFFVGIPVKIVTQGDTSLP